MIHAEALDQSALSAAVGRDVPDVEQLDDLGYELAFQASEEIGSGLGNLWEKAKEEFRVLLCTDEPRYADVREKASKLSSDYTTALVAAVSAAMGAAIGVAAATITPLVALLLLVLARVGKSAICNLSWGA